MGSKAGWTDVLTGGGASAARKAARAQEEAAAEQARLAEEQARKQRAQELAPVQVSATQLDSTTATADELVNAANKRKRTLSSTSRQLNTRSLGSSNSYLG